MIDKNASSFDAITNGSNIYGKFNCEFLDCFIHEFFLSNGYFAYGRVGSLRSRDMHLRCAIYLLCKCDIDKRRLSAIYSPLANVVESTLFINPHAAQFAAYRAAGISLAIGQISQIREDLYRFSLSALSDKLNFPRAWSAETYHTAEFFQSRILRPPRLLPKHHPLLLNCLSISPNHAQALRGYN